MYDGYGSIPLLWILPEAAVDPKVVAEYQANMSIDGPVRHMEFVKAVYK
jgi:hypothetical protein